MALPVYFLNIYTLNMQENNNMRAALATSDVIEVNNECCVIISYFPLLGHSFQRTVIVSLRIFFCNLTTPKIASKIKCKA